MKDIINMSVVIVVRDDDDGSCNGRLCDAERAAEIVANESEKTLVVWTFS
jgi:hypothetical protein